MTTENDEKDYLRYETDSERKEMNLKNKLLLKIRARIARLFVVKDNFD